MAKNHYKNLAASPLILGIFFVVFAVIFQRFFNNFVQNIIFANFKAIAEGIGRERKLSESGLLRAENQRLLEQLLDKEELGRENKFLRQMLYEYGPWSPHKQFARVLLFSPARPNELLYINQGTRQGVVVGDVVLAGEKTLIGRIKEVYNEAALVETIFSRDLKIGARILPIGRSQGQASVDGLLVNTNGMPEITLIPEEFDVQKGDLVETSGRDGIFFKGFLIGKVTTTEADANSRLKAAKIEVPYRLRELETVVLVRKPI